MISIHKRQKEIEYVIIPGHWEGDLIVGKDEKFALGFYYRADKKHSYIGFIEKV
jgi:IS30 family transposase